MNELDRDTFAGFEPAFRSKVTTDARGPFDLPSKAMENIRQSMSKQLEEAREAFRAFEQQQSKLTGDSIQKQNETIAIFQTRIDRHLLDVAENQRCIRECEEALKHAKQLHGEFMEQCANEVERERKKLSELEAHADRMFPADTTLISSHAGEGDA